MWEGARVLRCASGVRRTFVPCDVCFLLLLLLELRVAVLGKTSWVVFCLGWEKNIILCVCEVQRCREWIVEAVRSFLPGCAIMVWYRVFLWSPRAKVIAVGACLVVLIFLINIIWVPSTDHFFYFFLGDVVYDQGLG